MADYQLQFGNLMLISGSGPFASIKDSLDPSERFGILFNEHGGIVSSGRLDKVRAKQAAYDEAGFGEGLELAVFEVSQLTDGAVVALNAARNGAITVSALIKKLSVSLVEPAAGHPIP